MQEADVLLFLWPSCASRQLSPPGSCTLSASVIKILAGQLHATRCSKDWFTTEGKEILRRTVRQVLAEFNTLSANVAQFLKQMTISVFSMLISGCSMLP